MLNITNIYFNDCTPAIAMLVIKNGVVVNSSVYGAARLEKGRCLLKANSNTAFNICCMNQHITAAAILFLEESGKLLIDNHIGMYLPDLPNELANVTIRELIFHISGLEDYTHNCNLYEFENNIQNGIIYDKQKIYSEILNLKTTENKGKFAHCRSGYFLLSLIIESVSGLMYFDFLKQSIFRNIVLDNTFMVQDYHNHDNYAEPYDLWPTFKPINWIKVIHPLGEGGLMMSINDFASWVKALISDKVFNQSDTLEKFLSFEHSNKQDEFLKDYKVGYGLLNFEESYKDKKYNLISHAGWMPGSTSLFGRVIIDTDEYWVAYFSNSMTSFSLFDILELCL